MEIWVAFYNPSGLTVIILLQGDKIIPFERPWSTMTRIESYPSVNERSVIKSMEQLAKGLVDFTPSVEI